MKNQKVHHYRGATIYPVDSADARAEGYRWYIGSTHKSTGMDYGEECCRHCYTLAEAKEVIDFGIDD